MGNKLSNEKDEPRSTDESSAVKPESSTPPPPPAPSDTATKHQDTATAKKDDDEPVRLYQKPDYVEQSLTDQFVTACGDGDYTAVEKWLLPTPAESVAPVVVSTRPHPTIPGKTQTVQLITRAINVDGLNGTTARLSGLMKACNAGNAALVELLIISGDANVNLLNSSDQSALYFAARQMSVSCLQLLLDRGADVVDRWTGQNVVVMTTQDGMFGAVALKMMERYRNRFAQITIEECPLIRDVIGIIMNYCYFIPNKKYVPASAVPACPACT